LAKRRVNKSAAKRQSAAKTTRRREIQTSKSAIAKKNITPREVVAEYVKMLVRSERIDPSEGIATASLMLPRFESVSKKPYAQEYFEGIVKACKGNGMFQGMHILDYAAQQADHKRKKQLAKQFLAPVYSKEYAWANMFWYHD